MIKTCRCGKKIPARRLEALPNTRTCVNCSQEQPVRGLMIVQDETTDVMVLRDEGDRRRAEMYDRPALSLMIPPETER